MFGVDQIVIGGIRLTEHRETLGVLFPWKHATVNDGASESRPVTTHELSEGVHYNIGAVLDRAQKDRRGNRVIDDQWNAVFVCNLSDRFNVADVSSRIPDTLAKHSARVIVNQRLYCLGLIRLRKADRDSLTRQDVGEQG